MKTSLKSITIIVTALLALILTRIGLSYLLILIALGLILPYFTGDKKCAVLSGILYATISYILSYPSGLFLINYMPTIDIPVNVSFLEVFFNLLMGLMIPVIIAVIVCYISAVIGKYVSNLIKQRNDNTKEQKGGYHFESTNNVEEYERNYENFTPKTNENFTPKTKKRLEELSPIQKAKNRNRYEKE